MNTFFIPPSPNWFLTKILACAPDNTLIYGSKNDIIIIHPTSGDESPKIEIPPDEGCNQRVVCVDVTPKWDSPNKWILSSWEDNVVKIWDMKKLLWKKCSPPCKGEKDNLIGAQFLSEDRILNVFETGTIVICHIPLMKFTHLSNIITGKVSITCFAPCPHTPHVAAFGLKNGLVVVANLKKNGTLLHKLRGHTGEVINLSWCPSPMNIFPQKPGNHLKITDDDNDVNKESESNINVDIDQENKEGKYTDTDKIVCLTSEEAEYDNSSSNIKLHIEDKELTDEVSTTKTKDEEITVEENVPDNNHVQHNLLIEKIENLIIEAEEKLVETKSEDIQNSAEIQVEENNTPNFEEVQIEEETSLKSDGTKNSISKENEQKISNLEEKHSEKKLVETKSEDIQNSAEIQVGENNTPNFEEVQIVEETSLKCDETKNSISQENEQKILSNSEEKHSEKISVEESKPSRTASTPVVEEPRKELLLASSGRDSSVNIWRAGSDGRLQCFFRLPEKKYYNKNKKATTTSWIAIKWITPFSLLVGTKRGELLKYILPKPLDGKKECALVHNEHSNLVFVIAAHIPILNEENWFVEKEVKIWTFSHDLFLLNTVLDTKITHASSIETFCALVNCMAYSTVDPNRIALGLSNGTIKIWNANNSSGKFFSTANYSPKIYGKITCLDWHPKNELVIAFSTEEGTIGLLNTNNKYKATWFQQYFASTVHKIQWAPYKGKTCLYATGKGHLVCFDPDETKEEPIIIKLSSDTVPYYFAWKLDMSLMLLSTNCGKIVCYDSDLTVMATYHNNKKITLMVWHPDSAITTSTRSFWVAAALDNVVHIYDFAEIMEKKGTLNIEDIVRTKIDVHYGNIKSMAWNQFDGDQLVTAGEDGLAHVLDASNGTVLASYCDNRYQPIKAIIWSPIQEDLLIMTMSRCANLIAWKLSDYKGPLNSDVLKECENHFKNSRKMNVQPQKDEEDGKKVKKVIKSAKAVILPGSVDTMEEKIKLLREFLEGEGNVDLTEESSNIQKLFGTKNDVLSLLSCSEKSHVSKQKFEAAATVSLFKGDLQNHITEAIEQYRVTPLLISLAPSVSMSLWQQACEVYAGQICEKPDADPLEVALYFLAGQNIEKAIQYLCEKEMYKEAFALAKVRLPPDSVILDDILSRWARFSSYCGNMETAAICYMKLGKYEEAVNLLFRRNDLNILSFALDLAKKTGNAEIIKAVEFRYNAFSKDDKIEIEKSNEILEKDVNVDVSAEKSDTSTEVIEKVLNNVNEQLLTESIDEISKDKEIIQAEEKIGDKDEREVLTDSFDNSHNSSMAE